MGTIKQMERTNDKHTSYTTFKPYFLKMNRLFGNSKPPAPSLTDQTASIDSRITTVDKKISLLDAELLKYKTQMAKMRPGPTKKQVQQKAIRVLKQKKLLENQRENMANTSFNMDQTNFTIQSLKDTQVTMSVKKNGMKAMKKENKKLNIGKIESMQDEMEDMMMDSEEIMGIMGRSYGVGNDIDEDDLEAELDALGEEFLEDEDNSYLDAIGEVGTGNLPAIPSVGPKNVQPVAEVDEFGLPVA